ATPAREPFVGLRYPTIAFLAKCERRLGEEKQAAGFSPPVGDDRRGNNRTARRFVFLPRRTVTHTGRDSKSVAAGCLGRSRRSGRYKLSCTGRSRRPAGERSPGPSR